MLKQMAISLRPFPQFFVLNWHFPEFALKKQQLVSRIRSKVKFDRNKERYTCGNPLPSFGFFEQLVCCDWEPQELFPATDFRDTEKAMTPNSWQPRWKFPPLRSPRNCSSIMHFNATHPENRNPFSMHNNVVQEQIILVRKKRTIL